MPAGAGEPSYSDRFLPASGTPAAVVVPPRSKSSSAFVDEPDDRRPGLAISALIDLASGTHFTDSIGSRRSRRRTAAAKPIRVARAHLVAICKVRARPTAHAFATGSGARVEAWVSTHLTIGNALTARGVTVR